MALPRAALAYAFHSVNILRALAQKSRKCGTINRAREGTRVGGGGKLSPWEGPFIMSIRVRARKFRGINGGISIAKLKARAVIISPEMAAAKLNATPRRKIAKNKSPLRYRITNGAGISARLDRYSGGRSFVPPFRITSYNYFN